MNCCTATDFLLPLDFVMLHSLQFLLLLSAFMIIFGVWLKYAKRKEDIL